MSKATPTSGDDLPKSLRADSPLITRSEMLELIAPLTRTDYDTWIKTHKYWPKPIRERQGVVSVYSRQAVLTFLEYISKHGIEGTE